MAIYSSPSDVVEAHNDGEITREEMIETLARWPYTTPQFYEDGMGSYGEVQMLHVYGRLDYWDMIAIGDRVVELTGKHPASWPGKRVSRRILRSEMTKGGKKLVTDWMRSYRAGEITYEEFKATILAWEFDRLPYPLWADHADIAPYDYKTVLGTWEEFIEFYKNGTLSHDEWWGIAGEHRDWAGAPHERPCQCDPVEGYIVALREPVMTEHGLLLDLSTQGNLYLSEYHPPVTKETE